MFHEFIAESAVQAVAPVAVFLFQLDECLRVGRAVYLDAAFGPLPRDVVVFRLDGFEQLQGPLAEGVQAVRLSVGVEQGDDGVDDDEVHRAGRQLLGIPEDYSAAAILLVGYADSSAEEADGVTGATERDPLDEQVTYVTAE